MATPSGWTREKRNAAMSTRHVLRDVEYAQSQERHPMSSFSTRRYVHRRLPLVSAVALAMIAAGLAAAPSSYAGQQTHPAASTVCFGRAATIVGTPKDDDI